LFYIINLRIENVKIGGVKMKYDNFRDFEEYYSKFYIENKYEEVLKILDKASEVLSKEVFKANIFTILLDQVRCYMILKEYDKSLEALDKLISQDFACPLHWSLFKPLFEDVRYFKLKRKNSILRAKLQEKAEFKYRVYLPEGYTAKKNIQFFSIFMGMEIT